MKEQELCELLNITECDFQNSLRGYYNTSFFHIYLDGEFDKNIEKMSTSNLGTFIHEYIHYFQNIGTYWGLYCSCIRYQEMLEFKSQIINSHTIDIPFQVNYSDNLKKQIELIKVSNGTSSFDSMKRWHINENYGIKINATKSEVYGKNIPQINLDIMFDDERRETIILGAHIIKESMASLYQSLIDPNINHDYVPYNIVKLLCKEHFPNIANDIEKLICVCYISLFSMCPGEELLSLLEEASSNTQINGLGFVENFINTRTVNTTTKNGLTIVEFFNDLINEFIGNLSNNLVSELDYISEALERVKLSNPSIPLLSVLYDPDKLSTDNIKAIVGYLGIPYIQTSTHGFHFPESTKDGHKEEDASLDVLEMIAQEAIFIYITRPQSLKMCPLYYMCGTTTYEKNGCYKSPWEKPVCSFTIVSDFLGIDKKVIKWTF